MPFSVEQFFEVFGRYNAAIWPLQVVAYVIGVSIVGLMWRPGRPASWAITTGLALMWAVNGIGYHLMFFSAINPAARIFAVGFLAETGLLALAPILFPDLRFTVELTLRSAVGMGLIAYAMVIYPLLGLATGHSYPATPVFGVAPCPTTIFTIGVLLAAPWSDARWILIIPCLWAAVGGTATLLLGVPQDAGLLVAMVIVLSIWVSRWRGTGSAPHPTGDT